MPFCRKGPNKCKTVYVERIAQPEQIAMQGSFSNMSEYKRGCTRDETCEFKSNDQMCSLYFLAGFPRILRPVI